MIKPVPSVPSTAGICAQSQATKQAPSASLNYPFAITRVAGHGPRRGLHSAQAASTKSHRLGDIVSSFLEPTSKRALNANAVKFHLTTDTGYQKRYEVFYKNLIRDTRRYYAAAIRSTGIISSRKTSAQELKASLTVFVRRLFGHRLEALGIKEEDMTQVLAALTEPRKMFQWTKGDAKEQ